MKNVHRQILRNQLAIMRLLKDVHISIVGKETHEEYGHSVEEPVKETEDMLANLVKDVGTHNW